MGLLSNIQKDKSVKRVRAKMKEADKARKKLSTDYKKAVRLASARLRKKTSRTVKRKR